MVPLSDKARASSTHRASTFLRSESQRIDETVAAASSVLVNSESSPPSSPKRSSPASSPIGGEGVVFYAEGLQIKIGRTFKGGPAALLEEPLAPKEEYERRCAPASSDTSAKEGNAWPLTRTWACDPHSSIGDRGTDTPSFGALPWAGRLFSGGS